MKSPQEVSFNSEYLDTYFTPMQGYDESVYVFCQGSGVLESCFRRFDSHRKSVSIAELGFGTGLNLWALLCELLAGFPFRAKSHPSRSSEPSLQLHFSSVDHTLLELPRLEAILEPYAASLAPLGLQRILEIYGRLLARAAAKGRGSRPIVHIQEQIAGIQLTLRLFLGQAGDFLRHRELFRPAPEFWFFDGHSPDRNPAMWQEALFRDAARVSVAGAAFSTFSAAGVVKRALRAAGWEVRRAKGFGQKRHMLVGSVES